MDKHCGISKRKMCEPNWLTETQLDIANTHVTCIPRPSKYHQKPGKKYKTYRINHGKTQSLRVQLEGSGIGFSASRGFSWFLIAHAANAKWGWVPSMVWSGFLLAHYFFKSSQRVKGHRFPCRQNYLRMFYNVVNYKIIQLSICPKMFQNDTTWEMQYPKIC